jgi:hypothetical protein
MLRAPRSSKKFKPGGGNDTRIGGIRMNRHSLPIILLITIAVAPASAQNLLTNPGFDNPDHLVLGLLRGLHVNCGRGNDGVPLDLQVTPEDVDIID